MYKYTIPRILPAITPFITWRVKTAKQVVYLTFDDGPNPLVTRWVLEQLQTYNAKATFFCVGDNVQRYPDTYGEILKMGHITGNHSFNHLNGWNTNNESYFDNISKCRELVNSDLFRPPFGRITLSQSRELRKQYRIIMWDILSRDFERNLDTSESLSAMIKGIRNGSVIVFHDSEKTFKNLKVLLPQILEFLHKSGYKMESL